ncbi:MAG: hypothetical protein JW803_02625, partial [Endomicrobiales bacterium]|nr:hypothetical protein [Endomicrobiales bacterium]
MVSIIKLTGANRFILGLAAAVLIIAGIMSEARASMVFVSSRTVIPNLSGDESLNKIVKNPVTGDLYAVGKSTGEIFVGRFSTDLTLISSATIPGLLDQVDEATDCCIDSAGNVYITGYVSVTGQDKNLFIGKYTPSLVLMSSVTYNDPDNGFDAGFACGLDNNGGLFVAGAVFSFGQGNNIYIGKYSADNLTWAGSSVTINGSASMDDEAYGIVISTPTGNVFVTGKITQGGPNQNIFIAKLPNDLSAVNMKEADFGSSYETGNDVVLFPEENELFVVGQMGYNNGDMYVGRFSAVDVSSKSFVYVNGSNNVADEAFGAFFGGLDYPMLYVVGRTNETGLGNQINIRKYYTNLVLRSSTTFGGINSDTGYGVYFDTWTKEVVVSGESWPMSNLDMFLAKFDDNDPDNIWPPVSINDLDASVGSGYGEIELSWHSQGYMSKPGPFTGIFRIDYSTDAGKSFDYNSYKINIATTNALTGATFYRTVDNLLPGATYYFRLWAQDSASGNWSDMSNSTSAASYGHFGQYVWDGGGAGDNASIPENWSGDQPPDSQKSVLFTSVSSKDCTWDVVYISSITLAADYTGTVTVSSSPWLNGDLSIRGGSFNVSNTTFTLTRDLNYTGGDFVTAGSTFVFSGAVTQYLYLPIGATFYSVYIDKPDFMDLYSPDCRMNILGGLSIRLVGAAEWNIANSTITLRGNATRSGGGSFNTGGWSKFMLAGGNEQLIVNAALNNSMHLEVNKVSGSSATFTS